MDATLRMETALSLVNATAADIQQRPNYLTADALRRATRELNRAVDQYLQILTSIETAPELKYPACPHLHTEIVASGYRYCSETGVEDDEKIALICLDCGAELDDSPTTLDLGDLADDGEGMSVIPF